MSDFRPDPPVGPPADPRSGPRSEGFAEATHDPFAALRGGIDNSVSVPTRPSFVAALRTRLELALFPVIELPERTPIMASDTPTANPTTLSQSLTPYLCVHDGVAAIAWYTDAFGAIEITRYAGDDGRIGHAELRIGTATIFLSDEYQEIGVLSPRTLGGSGFALHLDVVDCDYTYGRAVEAGATELSTPEDKPHGNRTATIRDPFGHRWMLAQPIAAPSAAEVMAVDPSFVVSGRVPSEPGYITMHTPDMIKAAGYFGDLFGWAMEGGGHVKNTKFPMGFSGPTADHRDVTLYFRVDDIDTYAAKVIELGGQVLLKTEYPSGGNAECVDNQGFRFDLFRPAPGY